MACGAQNLESSVSPLAVVLPPRIAGNKCLFPATSPRYIVKIIWCRSVPLDRGRVVNAPSSLTEAAQRCQMWACAERLASSAAACQRLRLPCSAWVEAPA